MANAHANTMKRLFLLALAAGTLAALPAASAAQAQQVTETVPLRWVGGLKSGQVVAGSSQRTAASADGASMSILTDGLRDGYTYTLWFTFFNHPEHCQFPPHLPDTQLRCGALDLLNPATDGNLVYGDGIVATGEHDAFTAFVAVGEPPEGELECGGGICGSEKVAFAHDDADAAILTNPIGAEYQATLRQHGPEDPRYMPAQVETLDGGCHEGEPYHPCRDEQASGFRAQLPLECTETADCLTAVASEPQPAPVPSAPCSYDDPERAFTWWTTARELATMVTVPVERVRGPDGVPEEFRIVGEELGQATLFVQIGDRGPHRIDDSKELKGRFGWIFVAIEPPDGHPALHRYILSFATDAKQLDRRMSEVGIKTVSSPRISFDEEEREGLPFTETETSASVRDRRTKESYGLAATFASQPALPLAPVHELAGDFDRGSVLWHKRGSQVIRVSFDVALHSWRFADSATLEASEGSALAEQLGATSVDPPLAAIGDAEVIGPVEVGTLNCSKVVANGGVGP